MYVLLVRFKFKPGTVDAAIAYLNEAAIASRQEPGCHMYIANQDHTDPDTIIMYEQYEDEAAVQAHRESAHFKAIVEARVLPLVESRVRETLTVVA